jgi:hypothetical protein
MKTTNGQEFLYLQLQIGAPMEDDYVFMILREQLRSIERSIERIRAAQQRDGSRKSDSSRPEDKTS